MPPKRIRIDETYLRAIQTRLTQLRSQVASVRAGVNPRDPGHPHGGPLASLTVRAGTDKFTTGVSVKTRIAAMGTQADQRLTGYSQKLSTTTQGISRVIDSSDSAEKTNTSLANGAQNNPS
ncbi:hypothetical protein ACFOOK_00885 [Micromonospora krabiensis]|uniref:Excreted virulence factor EspC, type VII ESX diderm n=1 Tax=Micromonospora krabiensis TaxID=307121 RepID=A0A1C3MXK6_9ACTN|nr:hypothetical protein [Micromonospora krabiensis]SBV25063.1 hypothetical protein GA0070620_0532 [Micromonospora krabiensis]